MTKISTIEINKSLSAAPGIVLREESDDWAILFDPDTDNTFTLNPVSVLVWKQLNGQNTFADILDKIREVCVGVPTEVEYHIATFLGQLMDKNLVAYV